MSTDALKTVSFLAVHLGVAFGVAYLLTGSVAIAGGLALLEPAVNAVAYFVHERLWRRRLARPREPVALA